MIPLFKVFIPDSAADAVAEVLKSGYIAEGPKASLFEQRFRFLIGNPNTAVVNSCTSAITLALRLSGVGPGDEVISTPQTCLATNEPILTAGADIVWADIDPMTGNIDPETIEPLITKKTKAIVFVDWAGIPAEFDTINKIAKEYGLKVIEDAAHALGSFYKKKVIGSHVDFTCFSFQAIKHLTTGDGGAIACKSREDCERAKLLRWFGSPRIQTRDPVNWDEDVLEPGYKMHMNDISAAIGLEQLKTTNEIVRRHKENARFLRENLVGPGYENIELLEVPSYSDPSYWLFTIKLPDRTFRARFSKKLIEAGIANSIVHNRNDGYSLFKKYKRSLPGMDEFASRMLNIPCGWWLTEEDIEKIVIEVKNASS